MKIIFLDGEKIGSPRDMYGAVREALGTDGLIGENLDALYDVLSTVGEEIGIIIVNTERLRGVPGIKWRGLLRMLEDLTAENEKITVLVDPFGTDPFVEGFSDE